MWIAIGKKKNNWQIILIVIVWVSYVCVKPVMLEIGIDFLI